jgi:Raf kinase inhibitor-like YbhB/YbcL family protein
MPVRFLSSLALCCAIPLAAQAAAFTVTSPDFADNAQAPAAGAEPACGGGTNTSPALRWSGAPPATKSFAIILTDVDNWHLAGASPHWIAYGIPATITAIPAGFNAQSPLPYVPGLNFAGTPDFHGYCPPKGDAPHHYVYSVFATDLAPAALAANLTRDALTAALRGHTLAGSSTIAQYGQTP